MSVPTPHVRPAAAFLLLAASLSLTACGDDPPSGSVTPCETAADCADPITQTCNLITGICETRPTPDTGGEDTDVPDAPTDTGGDIAETTPDVPDTTEETDSGPDVPPDVTDTGDTTDIEDVQPDVQPDVPPDVPEVDIVDPPPGVNPWIAYIAEPRWPTGTSPLDTYKYVAFIQADGTNRLRLTPRDFDGENEPEDAVAGTPAPEDFQATIPAWSRDGNSLAYIRLNLQDGMVPSQNPSTLGQLAPVPHLRVVNFEAGTDREIIVREGTDPLENLQNLAWHPNGTQMAVTGRQVHREGAAGDSNQTTFLFFVDLATGNATRITDAGDRVGSPQYNADGSVLYFTRRSGENADVWAINTTGDPSPRSITSAAQIAGSIRISRDGDTLAFQRNAGGGTGRLNLFSIASPNFTVIGDVNDGDPSFFPDGSRLAIKREVSPAPDLQTDLVIVNASNGSLVRRLFTRGDTISQADSPAVSPIDADDIDLDDFTTTP